MLKKSNEIQPIFLTAEKVASIKKELTEIENIILPEIRKRMASAYEDGDIPENNPFITANEDMQHAMKRRNDLRYLLVRNKAYNKAHETRQGIGLGSEINLSINNAPPQKITLVSSEEANPLEGKLSIDSPIGKGIMQNITNSHFTIETPGGKIHIRIL